MTEETIAAFVELSDAFDERANEVKKEAGKLQTSLEKNFELLKALIYKDCSLVILKTANKLKE